MKHRPVNIVLTACLCLCLTGCVSSKRTRISYTVYPIGYLISRLAGSLVPYQSIQDKSYDMVQNASITDDFETKLSKSSVLFHIGNLEPYYAVFENRIEKTGVSIEDLSSGNAVYAYGKYEEVTDDNGEVSYVTVPYYDDVSFDHIDVLRNDLYLWMDPIAMLSMAKQITSWLITKYPSNKASFTGNYIMLENDLIELDAQYQNMKNSLKDTDISIVTMSSGFGCWQKSYGIEIYPVVQSVYGVLPNEEQIQAMEREIMDNGVKYIAFESNMNEEMTDLFYRIQADCGLTRIELSNMSCLSENEELEGKDYLSLMYQNLNVLQGIIAAESTVQE